MGESCGLPAEVRLGYALHNLCYTKLILALFKASVKFHKRILYKAHSFPICAFSRILEQFSQRNAPGGSFSLPVYSCEYTFSTAVISLPCPEGDLPLVELCRVWRGSCSFDGLFGGGGCWLGCSFITMRRHLPKREKIEPPSPLYKSMQA